MVLENVFLVFFGLFLVTCAFCKGISEVQCNFNTNDTVDFVLESLRDDALLLSKLDPLEIPAFNKKCFEIKEGQVRGLSSLYRHGDCTFDYDGEVVKVSSEVAIRYVTINLKYAAKALFFWIKGNVTVSVSDLAVEMDISGQDGRAKLELFEVINLGKYKIEKITGMGVVLNWLLKLIANAVANKSRGEIIHAFENGVATAVKDLFNKYKLPNLSTFASAMDYVSTFAWVSDYLSISESDYLFGLSILNSVSLDRSTYGSDSGSLSTSAWDFLSNFASDYQERLGFSISFGGKVD